MPELPEVETTCRGLEKYMQGKVIRHVFISRPDLRKPMPDNLISRIEGKHVNAIKRRAKYILIFLEGQYILLIHLGMSGRIIHSTLAISKDKHDHFGWQMEGGDWFHFRDPRRFGLVDLIASNQMANYPLLKELGPEPLDQAFGARQLAEILKGRQAPIKNVLLNQHIIAGVGNIYACESLFYAGILPFRPAASLNKNEVTKLWQMIRRTLEKAIQAGGSSARDYVQPDGQLGTFQQQWAVYGKEQQTCPNRGCKRPIQRENQAGRSTFYCAHCQQ